MQRIRNLLGIVFIVLMVSVLFFNKRKPEAGNERLRSLARGDDGHYFKGFCNLQFVNCKMESSGLLNSCLYDANQNYQVTHSSSEYVEQSTECNRYYHQDRQQCQIAYQDCLIEHLDDF